MYLLPLLLIGLGAEALCAAVGFWAIGHNHSNHLDGTPQGPEKTIMGQFDTPIGGK